MVKKVIQQGRSHVDARSVLPVREHGKMARTPLVAFLIIPTEVYSAIQRILAHPQAWPILDEEIRRYQTKRFPFGILYAVEKDEIFIIAIMHLHRDPGYRKQRGS